METSLQTDIPYYTCYRFIRTIIERIASSSKSNNVKLMGVIEADEFYILDMSDIDRGSRRVQKNGPFCTPQMMLYYLHPQLAHNDLYWADSYELDFPLT